MQLSQNSVILINTKKIMSKDIFAEKERMKSSEIQRRQKKLLNSDVPILLRILGEKLQKDVRKCWVCVCMCATEPDESRLTTSH